MKTIILPTDFSPAANNAANYASALAMQLDATLLLLHVYQVPIAITDAPLILVSVDELKKSAENKLRSFKSELERVTARKLPVTTQARLGNFTNELEDLSKTIHPFAVVMGTTGHSAVERTLFGSNTLSAIKHLTSPVICVPMGKEFGAGIRKIGLACDFREIEDTTPIPAIKNFIREFGAELHVLNVDHDNKNFNVDTPEQAQVLDMALADLHPNYHFIEDRDIEAGINRFAEENNLDLIISIPKKHKLMEGLFRKSTTRQLVFESHVPVMCVHEE